MISRFCHSYIWFGRFLEIMMWFKRFLNKYHPLKKFKKVFEMFNARVTVFSHVLKLHIIPG